MKRLPILLGLLALTDVPAGLLGQAAVAVRDDVERAALAISAEDFARRVGVIAHDSMRGRDTPSPELEATARWIESEFRRFGLQPGGDGGSFIQRYPIRMMGLDFGASTFRASPGGSLAFGADVLPVVLGAPISGRGEGSVVVLSGSSELERAGDWDLAGRTVVLFLGDDVQGGGGAILGLIQTLRSARVASVVVATAAGDADWNAAASDLESARFAARGGGGGTPVLQVRDEALARVWGDRDVDVASLRSGASGALRRLDVESLSVSVAQEVGLVEDGAPNVVGILEGADPALRDEYVVFSAHMDHVGVGLPDASGDSIYNGADDNGSGTAAVIAVAEAMASLETAPARSMIFLLVSGEEKGLWGSAHFADHPPVPVESLVANINIDMVGRNWPDTIVAIGREHSDLGETLARVNDRHPELGMTAIDDLWPEERFYFRSDHYNFARKGVPALFFFNGVHEDYHRPGDVPEKIDAEKAARIARLVFYVGLEIGDAPERPRWNPESYRSIVGDRPPR